MMAVNIGSCFISTVKTHTMMSRYLVQYNASLCIFVKIRFFPFSFNLSSKACVCMSRNDERTTSCARERSCQDKSHKVL